LLLRSVKREAGSYHAANAFREVPA